MDHLYLKAFDKSFKIIDESIDLEVLGFHHNVTIYRGNDVDKVDYKKLETLDVQPQFTESLLKVFSTFYFFMPDGRNLNEFLPSFLWPRSCRVGESLTFFGGSFDPWHEGHSECLRQCLTLEEGVVIIPDYSPWKSNVKQSVFDEILDITKKTNKKFIIYPGFWTLKERNPTSLWIRNVSHPHVNWLMGDDTFSGLLKWFEIEEFLKKVNRLYVVPRIADQNSAEFSKVIESVVERVDLIFLERHEFQHLSSTNLRTS